MWRDLFVAKRATIELPDAPPVVLIPDRRSAVRYQLDAPVIFLADDQKHLGRCINVSDSGLLGRFVKPPELWTDGKLDLQAGEHYLDINARVARCQGDQVGFAFSAQDDNDHAALDILLKSVATSPVIESPESEVP